METMPLNVIACFLCGVLASSMPLPAVEVSSPARSRGGHPLGNRTLLCSLDSRRTLVPTPFDSCNWRKWRRPTRFTSNPEKLARQNHVCRGCCAHVALRGKVRIGGEWCYKRVVAGVMPIGVMRIRVRVASAGIDSIGTLDGRLYEEIGPDECPFPRPGRI